MRIAHIDTERTWRGGQQQVLSLVNGLADRGHENHVIVRRGSALSNRITSSKIAKFELSPFGEWDFIAAHHLNRYLRGNKIEILHAHSGHGVSLAVFSNLGLNLPVVLTRRVDFHLKGSFFSKLKYGRCDKFIAISEGVKRVLLEDGISPEKISLVPSGIDFAKFASVKPISKTDLGFPADAIVIGQVAALADHKDQNTFLEAIEIARRSNPRVRAVIVGDGPLEQKLKAKSAALGLNDFVLFTGYKDNPLDYLAGFDLFCLSSKEEGLGTSLLDAMALKIPIVATDAGGIPDIVKDELTGFLCPIKDPAALAAAIIRCLASQKSWPLMQERAHQMAKNHDIERTILSTEQVYRGVL